jgi:GT2 family glycosyltransferase
MVPLRPAGIKEALIVRIRMLRPVRHLDLVAGSQVLGRILERNLSGWGNASGIVYGDEEDSKGSSAFGVQLVDDVPPSNDSHVPIVGQGGLGVQKCVDFGVLGSSCPAGEVDAELGELAVRVRSGGLILGSDLKEGVFADTFEVVERFFRRFGWEFQRNPGGGWWGRVGERSVTYIVPAYNCERTILETLGSIVNGNLETGDEIVVVDDCSTDSTAVLLKEFATRTGTDIRILRHSENRGGGAARNTAVLAAKNSLIFCLDSDNVLAPGSVRSLIFNLIRSAADSAAFQELRYFRRNIRSITHMWVFPAREISFEDALSSVIVPISSGNYLYTKNSWEQVGGYPEDARALDAWGFGFRQLAHGQKMIVVKESGYFHRYGHESYWKRESKKASNAALAFRIVSPFLSQISPESISYISAGPGAQNWFDGLDTRPLKTVSGKAGGGGRLVSSPSFRNRLRRVFDVVRAGFTN